MSKTLVFALIVGAAIILFIISVALETRIAAGGGALLLLGGIIYGYVQNKRAGPGSYERAERGAREVREELVKEEEDAGTR